MPPAGFKPTISAGERPQTYALDRAATGTGIYIYIYTVRKVSTHQTITFIHYMLQLLHLPFKILVVSLCTTNFSVQYTYVLSTVNLCVLYGSKDKKRGSVRGNLTIKRVRITIDAVEMQ